MPIYAFHLDISATPEVVAERIHATVGTLPSFWQRLTSSWKAPQRTGFQFLGTVTGDVFNIRRNIQYRNSFLPIIRGKIVPTPAGSRVNVLMYMHPFSLVFLLAWFGYLFSIESKLVNSDIARSYFPLGVLIFGLIVSLGGFYFEALKVMPLLSAAAFNPAIVAVSASTSEPQRDISGSAPNPTNPTVPLVGFLVLLLLAALILPEMYRRHLKSSPAYDAVMDLASHAEAITRVLGNGIIADRAVRGVVHQDSEAGYAALAIPVRGRAGKGILYAVANRVESGWDIERASLRLSGPAVLNKVDFTPPTRREPFNYPITGKVFLLPLDAAADSDLALLPPYLKARFNMDVTVLPVRSLDIEEFDSKRKQAIAEKVLTSIEDQEREITTDPNSIIISVTSQDLNIRSFGWEYALNYRRGRLAIVSTARLHGLPWYAGENPEIYALRVQKIIAKNAALMLYPVQVSPDPSSLLAANAFTIEDFDKMGENLGGEHNAADSIATEPPCVTILQGPRGNQGWRLNCPGDPPADSRFEMFVNYPANSLFVMSRTDFTFKGEPGFPFMRKFRPQDDRSRAFGLGAADSFDIYPAGDSQTFSEIELILPDGGRIHYARTSTGTGYADAKLRARTYYGSPFSQSSLAWNGNGWDLLTSDHWTYQFPSSGPDRTWQQGALIGIRSAAGKTFSIRRNDASDLQEIRSPDGEQLRLSYDVKHRITSASQSSGRQVQYEYDAGGRLSHTRDLDNGDEYYRYDPANRLISVEDGNHHSLLRNVYGYMGEIRSQTLANGETFVYESGYNENRELTFLKLTLPNRYKITWIRGRDGFVGSWPKAPDIP